MNTRMCNFSGGSDEPTVTVGVHVCADNLCQRVPLPLPRLKMCASLECFCVTGRRISNRGEGGEVVEADASEQKVGGELGWWEGQGSQHILSQYGNRASSFGPHKNKKS